MHREASPADPSVRDLLARVFTHLVTAIGAGKHGPMRLAMAEYNFGAPLVGFRKSARGYSGWYAPHVGENWKIGIRLHEAEVAGLKQIKVNGKVEPLPQGGMTIKFSGEGSHEEPFSWEAS
jgi:hypothetical protein